VTTTCILISRQDVCRTTAEKNFVHRSGFQRVFPICQQGQPRTDYNENEAGVPTNGSRYSMTQFLWDWYNEHLALCLRTTQTIEFSYSRLNYLWQQPAISIPVLWP